MGERSHYPPGTFSWADLSTTDPGAAKEFYGALFGWQAEDLPVPGGGAYSIQRLDGKSVAAIAAQPQQQRDAGAPPAWQSYVTVDSADATAQRAQELGGKVHAPAFDVMDAGRMTVLQDPQGAFFMAWEPRQHIGAGLVNVPGALCWNELAAADLDRAPEFYRDLFGWEVEPFEGGSMRYLTIKNDGRGNGGMREAQPGEPGRWLVYFATDDVEVAMAKVRELGGNPMSGPHDMGIGKLGVVQDPQGAVFALYAGELEP